MKCREVEDIAKCVKEVMKNGYMGEQDLFIARTMLDLMARCETFDNAKKFKKIMQGVVPQTPILNFIDMIEDIIRTGDIELFREVKKAYEKEVSRDPTFIQVKIFCK